MGDFVGGGERSKEGWGFCGRETHTNLALDIEGGETGESRP